MTTRQWSDGGGGGSPEQHFAFAGRQHVENRISGDDFAFDANGNATRFLSSVYEPHAGARWTPQNRMHTATVDAEVETEYDRIVENYLYDAAGDRIVTRSHHGQPRISVRDSSGQLVSEFIRRQGANGLALDRDYLYGAGQLLVERQVDFTTPTLVAYAPLGVKIQPGFSSDTYLLDIRTADGPVAQLVGTVPVDGKIALSESNIVIGEVNFIRVRAVDGATTAYSSPITLFIDPTVEASTPNQVRSLAVSRNGLNIEILAGLYQDNGRMVNLYFKAPDDPPIAVTNLSLSLCANVRETLTLLGITEQGGEVRYDGVEA